MTAILDDGKSISVFSFRREPARTNPATPATRNYSSSHYSFSAFTASVARLSIVLGNNPIQNMPAMQIARVTLAGPESKIGDKSAGASWLQ
jgi:hypothetical protein